MYAKGMSLYLFVLFIKKSPLANAGALETCRFQFSMTTSSCMVCDKALASFHSMLFPFIPFPCCAALCCEGK